MKINSGLSLGAIAVILGTIEPVGAIEGFDGMTTEVRDSLSGANGSTPEEFTKTPSQTLEKSEEEIFVSPSNPSQSTLFSDRNDGNDSAASLLWTSGRPDGHAPIGVMGDHTHSAGEFMFSYRFMYMNMDGNRSGTDSLSEAEVLQQFPVTPVDMTMKMHMFGAMYAPTNDLTLMAMTSYIFKEMDHLTRRGVRFTTNTQGFGDSKLVALYRILNRDRQRLHLNLGLGLPTGSIGERDDTPAGQDVILPYPMQIGSGTFDILAGATYLGQQDRWSWGAQVLTTLPLGENSNGYRLGNQFNATGWGAYKWTDWLSASVRLNGKTWGDIDGADSRLNPMMIPTADPNRRGGTRLDLGLGLNLYAPQGSLAGTRLGIEFSLPIYQSLTGPQLETDWKLTVGVQAAF
ncbi:transporter [Lusitaniella coriacea LEGE 07157]|uniref:Transporter n=1 Tax=Lusitaniella coriacea LEGE 07157 TaxID=945747 RepID=A0A8J7AWV5_9CYAN|nr:transporter [Lusitaniella coriacea]MBE9114972.1 transporter [Lusitaniella coriacea LEGE 07157]